MIEATFGQEAGALLWSQAEVEERFDQENMSHDRQHMQSLDGDFETKAAKNKAKRNAIQMKANIMKLVQIFKDEQLQNKLLREFRLAQGGDIASFIV